MKKKLYSFTLILLLGCFASANAQGTDSLAYPCNASFATNANLLQVSFWAIDSFRNVLHTWDFGDGDSNRLRSCQCSSPVHTYGAAGTYTVTHFVRDTLGRCFDSVTQLITVASAPPCAISLFVMRDSLNGHLYHLSASVPGPAQPMDTVSWYINDTFYGIGANLNNVYLHGPTSTVCARLTRASGCFAQQCQTVNVDSLAGCILYPSFTYQADSSNRYLIHFTPDPNGDSLHYHWNFGDSTGSYARTPSHVYAQAGSYYVTLSITGYSGTDSCTVQTSQGIYITPPPDTSCTASFAHLESDPNMPNELTFYVQHPTTYDSAFWKISPVADTLTQTILSGGYVTYTFPDTGRYKVTLVVVSSTCTALSTQVIEIDSLGSTPPPVDTCTVSFTYLEPDTSMPNKKYFYLTHSIAYDSVEWFITPVADTANLTILKGSAITYTFPDTGRYIVHVAAFGATCTAQASLVVGIDSLGSTVPALVKSYPNPVVNEAYIDVKLPGTDRIYISVYNSMGKLVLTKVVTGYADMNHIGIPVGGLQSGIYYVRIQYGNVIKQSKIQKL